MDLFGVMLTFHGMVVFVQEGRFWQMTVKTVLSLLLGWHVFALLLTFILLGAVGELFRARPIGPGHVGRACSTASAVTPFLRRCVALGAVALLVGLSILTFNFVNEWLALNGKVALTELPSVISMLRRFGADQTFYTMYLDKLAWPSFLETQFARMGGGISLPFSVTGRVHSVAAMHPTTSTSEMNGAVIGYVVSGACLASLVSLTFVRRFRQRRYLLPLATLALFGFAWSLPMRANVAFHDYESLFHIGIPLVLFSLVLQATSRLAGSRSLVGLAFAALAVFVFSAYEMGRINREAVAPGFQKAVLADFEAIREITAGRSVVAAVGVGILEFIRFAGARYALHYYMAGSSIAYSANLDSGEFLITHDSAAGIPSLTPDNNVLFLYDSANLIEAARPKMQSIRSGRPVGRSLFDVYMDDPGGDRDARTLSYVREHCGWRDRSDAFFLDITPVNPGNLPADRAEYGFESRRFSFHWEYGLAFDGACMVSVDLPGYEVARIATGQLTDRPEQGR